MNDTKVSPLSSKRSLDELIMTVKEAPISAIVGHYLPITVRGTSKLSLCPFHHDTRPSMNINDSKRFFKCFACGAAGDSIAFVQKYKNLGFKESLEEIANILGIDFSQFKPQKEKDPRLLLAQKILTRASLLYRKIAEGVEQKNFSEFLDNRGLKVEMASRFAVGLAPRANVVTDYLKSIAGQDDRQKALEMAQEIGLIRPGKDGKSHYDTFRERIMFPIWDHQGLVMGFTGRDITGQHPAKYYNSQESLVFHKRHILYGLHFAKSFIRERNAVIICEGNMDLIALHQNGLENSVAIMGTAMDPASIKLLKALTPNFILALDNDKAGHLAAERINTECMSHSMLPKFLSFEPAKDPDEFLQKFGALELMKRLENAPLFIDHLIQTTIPKPIPTDLEGKLEVLKRIFTILAPLKTDLQATERLAQAATSLGLRSGADTVLSQYQDFLRGIPLPRPPKETPKIETQPSEIARDEEFHQGPSNASAAPRVKLPPMSIAERSLILAWLYHPQYFTHDKQLELLDLVHSSEVKRYLGRLRELFFEVDDSEFAEVALDVARKEEFDAEIGEVVGKAIWAARPVGASDPKILERLGIDLNKKLKEEKLQAYRKELREKYASLSEVEEEQKVDLMRELGMVEKDLSKLRSPTK